MKEQKISAEPDHAIGELRRKIRLIQILDAAEMAGLSPISVGHLHTFAYMSNVLSPVWSMPVFDGKVFKRPGSPFYPLLQNDLDRLVGLGIVLVSEISHVLDEDQQWRIEGSFRLNRIFANRILESIAVFEDESGVFKFIQELAYALSALSRSELARASTEDATYADPMIDVGNVVDFAEWNEINYSANAALHFEGLLPSGARATPGEMLHLYVHHLYGRLQGV